MSVSKGLIRTLSVYHPSMHDAGHQTGSVLIDFERDALKHSGNGTS